MEMIPCWMETGRIPASEKTTAIMIMMAVREISEKYDIDMAAQEAEPDCSAASFICWLKNFRIYFPLEFCCHKKTVLDYSKFFRIVNTMLWISWQKSDILSLKR